MVFSPTFDLQGRVPLIVHGYKCLRTFRSGSLTVVNSFAGVYVPTGGKKLLTFLDDLNMPAKDTFGSQPPLELIRHWIDYGFWYDRQKQIVKHIKVRLHSSCGE